MATVFSPPKGFDPPEWDPKKSFQEHQKAEDDYVQKLADALKAQRPGNLVGRVVSFPIADGCAQYMVASEKPLQLVHLPLGDAWQIPAAHARGLRLSDIRQMLGK
jgi:hypothetical protein